MENFCHAGALMFGGVFMRVKRVRALLASALAASLLSACVGGGNSLPTNLPIPSPTAGSSSGTPSSSSPATQPNPTSGNSCPSAAAGLPVQGAAATGSATGNGTISWLVCDYFTKSVPAGVAATIDGAPVTASAGGFTTAVAAGTHVLLVTATGYAVYHGAITVPRGAPLRVIQLFPVSSAMQAWFAGINSDRTANGAPVLLGMDDVLTIAAFDHAADMTTLGYFSHPDLKNLDPFQRASALGGAANAENIAGGQSTWQQAEQGFMAEKATSNCATGGSHYCNIIDPQATWVGLGLAQKTGGMSEYEQDFSTSSYADDPTVSPPTASEIPNLYFSQALELMQ